MKLLIAEDDEFFRKILRQILGPNHEIVVAHDGEEAWEMLQKPDAPRVAILDWVMPGLSGPQVCRKVRACPHLASMYLIILTAKNNEADIVSGLRAGADDYITKPPLAAELLARVRVGERVMELQAALEKQSADVTRATAPEGGPLADCPTNQRLVRQEHFPGSDCCSRPHCESGDCCSAPSGDTEPFRQLLLTTSLESRHPHH